MTIQTVANPTRPSLRGGSATVAIQYQVVHIPRLYAIMLFDWILPRYARSKRLHPAGSQ